MFNTASLFMLDTKLKPIIQPYGKAVALHFVDLETDREMLINFGLIDLVEQAGTQEVEGTINLTGSVESSAGTYALSVYTKDISSEAEARRLIDRIATAVYEVYTYKPPAASTESQTL
jgi:hypothetical protein